jgi:hypothetical protein
VGGSCSFVGTSVKTHFENEYLIERVVARLKLLVSHIER